MESHPETKPVGVFLTLEAIYQMMVNQGEDLRNVKESVGKIPDTSERLEDHGKRLNAIEGQMKAHAVIIGISTLAITTTISFIISRVIGA